MNAVEIEQAVSDLAAQPFDAAEFPFQFLAAFGKKDTQLKRLRKGDTNRSDVPNGVLLQSSIHLAIAPQGETRATLERLKVSPKTAAAKAKFVLATDGQVLEAEDLNTGEAIAPDYGRFAEHIGFFLPLAGISTVREIKDNPIDVRATGRLNKLYQAMMEQNPDWSTEARRHDMNHFMARLIFCFFAEDTDIFLTRSLFTSTIEQFSESDGTNTHVVLEAVFAAMNLKQEKRNADNTPGFAVSFPYVNGGLFSGSTEVPRFTRIARSYLLQAGSLDWKHINPDIFGSMIQAVADDEERGALGMHYTSVPNILKVLNPLFLDELRAQLEVAGENGRMLLNLRRRLSRIRVFDPACGSGNFLVIAYKEMRKMEADINGRRGEHLSPSEISKKNFRGIEIRDFAAEIARLALVIAEYQCDVLHRGPLAAKAEFLPLDEMNWITCGNALRLDWLQVCPPEGTGVKLQSDDLFQTPLDQPEIDFENEGGETYICGNPPYKGYNKQSAEQKADLASVFSGSLRKWGNLDYVAAWMFKASQYMLSTKSSAAFVMTNTVCQGGQVSVLWPPILETNRQAISFAYTSFKWANLASHNAGITVVVVGIRPKPVSQPVIFGAAGGAIGAKIATNINAYLIPAEDLYVSPRQVAFEPLSKMSFGNHPYFGAQLLMSAADARKIIVENRDAKQFLRPIYGSTEIISGRPRACLWVQEDGVTDAEQIPELKRRFDAVGAERYKKQSDTTAKALISKPYRFRDTNTARVNLIAVPPTSSENRHYLPCAVLDANSIVTFKCFAMYDAPLWNMALIASRVHWVWIGTVCGRLEMRFSYSNTLGWNTFPVPSLTEQNKADLTRCAEDILLAREAHFPATIADLYDPETMPNNLRAAHDANDETLERIYIGRRFRNDTERLETLFEMYAEQTSKAESVLKRRTGARR